MRALVTGALQATAADLADLEALGLQITLHPDERTEVPDPAQYEIVLCNGLFSFQDIDRFSNLKYIQLTAAGLDRIPLARVRERGIMLHNAAGVYSIPMAEFALTGVLELYKESRFFHENQRLHRWEKHRGLRELAGKTVCIVGCGSVGTECARRFAAFGCHVTGVARTPRQQPHFHGIYPVDRLAELLPGADIVVLALPLTADTRHLFDDAMFALMKPGSVLVNLARGTIVDTGALVRALETTLSGAVIDVFETEPLADTSPLWDIPNLILTPHNSFVGEHNHARMMELVLRNLRNWRNQ